MTQLVRITVVLLILMGFSAVPARSATIDYNRDIKPILSDKCYACHGPDREERQGGDPDQGGLHFETQQSALADLGGYFAIVPGEPESSELVRRISSSDPDEVMPPTEHRKKLSREERQLLIDWVKQGAVWSQHWAFVPPARQALPAVENTRWPLSAIDQFILARLEEVGIQPSPEADRRTLLRRLSFDLIGLPPSPTDLEAFIDDHSPDAYEKVVDRLLKSPHYGERMATYWLDLVRYADTVGYHGDQPVSVSPYRDYVIDAFNGNMPFDRFTREQLGGDLLPEPTEAQLIASGYNRLGMMSAEGGVQPKEYLAKYASDRVRTASSVWLGTTLGCAECHDHKFDPFTTKDFYRFASFFADIKERGLYAGAHADGQWGPKIRVDDAQFEPLVEPVDARLAELQSQIDTPTPELAVAQQEWETALNSDSSVAETTSKVTKGKQQKLPQEITELLKVPVESRDESQRNRLAAHYRSIAPSLAGIRKELEDVKRQRAKIVSQHTRTTLITVAVKPRVMRVLPRGNWMDDSGEQVQPGVPQFMPQIARAGRATRLDLADWVTSRDNPLTARVFVNRLWKLYFGTGLSKVLDDVGAQGDAPSHPGLLDTLAVDFTESGWDIKQMVKLLVMSRSYRQSSMVRDDLRDLDPYNRLYARQSRFRLDAEMIRDNALAVSDLLVRQVGGQSARPYQPIGLYQHLNFPKRTYQHDQDANQYRRGVYTHWQRQFLHPAMKTFDAPAREECTAERPRSNTPLAALVLLNDPSYVEAARVFAEQAIQQGGENRSERINWMLHRAISRAPSDAERQVLDNLLSGHLEHYAAHQDDARKVVEVGLRDAKADIDVAELAAWTSVARTIFNLHEFITRN